MEWTFGTFMWSMVGFFFWFVTIWMFISVFADIFRRSMSGWAKAGWIAVIALLPFFGVLIYLVAVPRTAQPQRDGRAAWSPTSQQRTPGYRAADEIAKAAQLHDQGKISADEFEHLKERALSH